MKLAIVGSRGFNDYGLFCNTFYGLFLSYESIYPRVTEIVSGGAIGADSLAERLVNEMKGPVMKVFLPDWDTHGKAAGFIRNKEIVGYSDMVLAFWDGQSKGTRHSINLALDMGKNLVVINTSK